MTRSLALFFILFALSGFAGLIYESIWTQYLKLFLGHAAYAQALVIAIFMGGMAVGSWLSSRYSSSWKKPLLGYAVTELLLGIFALTFHVAFELVTQFSYSTVIPNLANPLIANTYKWVISALLILPQTVLLGMTFPLMTAGILRLFPQNPGSSISLLYFTNSIGAAIGVLVSGFILIGAVGLPGTIQLAGTINIGLAVAVWLLSKEAESGPVAGSSVEQNQTRPESRYRAFLIASLVTGMASFIYEIGWIRMLVLVLGSTTHAFELILSSFIFGIAIGGLWIKRRIDQVIPVRFFSVVQIIMGILALSTLPLYGNIFGIVQWIVKTLPKNDAGYLLFNLSSDVIALAIMFPATFCAGMTLPLLTCSLLRDGYGERSIGAVYAANAIGSIMGVFFAINIGMPLLGLKGMITFGASLDILLGLAFIWTAAAGFSGTMVPIAATSISVILIAGTLFFVQLDPYKMASGVYRYGALIPHEKARLLYHKDGKTSTVSVILDGSKMSIHTNGKSDAALNMDPRRVSGSDEPTMVLAASIPMAIKPDARTVANIGFGSGLTSHTLMLNPLLKSADTVEIEKSMVEGASYFDYRVALAYDDPRSRIHFDDAKTFFSVHNRTYDIIISEPSNVWVSGVAGLFSREFYSLISKNLTENGLFVQWIHLYEIDSNMVVSALKAVSGSFSDFAVYATNDTDILIVAVKNGTVPTPDPYLFNIPQAAAALKVVNVENIQDLEIRKIGNKKLFDKLMHTFRIEANSDYYPIIDQNAGRSRFLKNNAKELIDWSNEPLPVAEMLMNYGKAWKETTVQSTPHFSRSRQAYKAMKIRDYILSGSLDANDKLSGEIVQNAILLTMGLDSCASIDKKVPLFNLAESIVPYLTPTELDSIWLRVESSACSRSFSAGEKNYMRLFKAIGNRDADAMVSAAETILKSGEVITKRHLRYVAAAGMLGNITAGNYDAAQQLWSTYKDSMFGHERPGVLFRLLLAHSDQTLSAK